MPKPQLFVGSSKKNLRAAKVLGECLEDAADVKIWDEDVFALNQGFLETLLEKLQDYDFAVFIIAPDDLTTSKEETRPSPRDNVLFESGLFMGLLGRSRVFLVCDQSAELKIPSDLAGVTLASYDGARIDGPDAPAAVRRACRLITDKIRESRFPHLVGRWKSIYPMTSEEGSPLCEETVEICPCRNGVSIITVESEHGDDYTAWGRLPRERQIIGEWQSKVDLSDTGGVFVLNVSPNANYMYGYFTSPDETGGVTYAGWTLVKIADADEATINGRLKKAQSMLSKTTVGFPS